VSAKTPFELVQSLVESGDDALVLNPVCDRTAFNAEFKHVSAHWGRPVDAEGRVLALIRSLAAGLEETAAAVWRHGSALTYLCWRGKTNGPGELFAGACSEHLIPPLFLSPIVIGGAHALRVAAARHLDAGLRPRPAPSEDAG
jgi:hypothetical protein